MNLSQNLKPMAKPSTWLPPGNSQSTCTQPLPGTSAKSFGTIWHVSKSAYAHCCCQMFAFLQHILNHGFVHNFSHVESEHLNIFQVRKLTRDKLIAKTSRNKTKHKNHLNIIKIQHVVSLLSGSVLNESC